MTRPLVARRRAGFTLVEVLLTVLIMGLMMTGITRTLTSVRLTRDRIHNIQETQLAGPAIVDLIQRDLLAIHVIDRPKVEHLRIQNRVEYGLDADRIDFVTTTDSRVPLQENGRAITADVCEVGYVTRVSPEDDEFLELYRREGFGVDDEFASGGSYTFLSDRVKALSIEVYLEDGPDEEPEEEWGLETSTEEFTGLPASIRISLTLENTPRLLREQIERSSRERSTVEYVRIIRFPEALRVEEDELPRFAIPVPSSEGGDPNDPTAGEGEEGIEAGGLPPGAQGLENIPGRDGPNQTVRGGGGRPPGAAGGGRPSVSSDG